MANVEQPYKNADGTIRVYREKYRQPHKLAGHINPVWKARLKLRGNEKAVKFNTRSKLKDAAIREAHKRYDQMVALDALGMSISPLTFAEIARRYLTTLNADMRRIPPTCSQEKHKLHERTIKNILNPAFEHDEIGKVTSSRITQLFYKLETTPIGLTYTYNGERSIKRPKEFYSASTLNKMKQVIRAIMRYARDMNFITNVPEISSTRVKDKIKKGMSRDQWDLLHNYLNTSFVTELDSKPTDQTRPKYYRKAFVDYFTLVVWTGLRAGEALHLQWRDIKHKTEDGEDYCEITCAARDKGAKKTGSGRIFRADIQVWDLLEKRKSWVKDTKETDYVFCHYDNRFGIADDGSTLPIKSMRGTFKTALDNLGLLYTDEDVKLTPYIGRHTHALLARELGKPLDDIAEDIGNLTTTTERFYVGRGQGLRKGKPIRI